MFKLLIDAPQVVQHGLRPNCIAKGFLRTPYWLQKYTPVIWYFVSKFHQLCPTWDRKCMLHLLLLPRDLVGTFVISALQHNQSNLLTKLSAQFFHGCGSIFQCIVQYGSRKCYNVRDSSSCQNLSHFQRMVDVGILHLVLPPLGFVFLSSKATSFDKWCELHYYGFMSQLPVFIVLI